VPFHVKEFRPPASHFRRKQTGGLGRSLFKMSLTNQAEKGIKISVRRFLLPTKKLGKCKMRFRKMGEAFEAAAGGGRKST